MREDPTIRLPDLQPGEEARIVRVEGDDDLATRLEDMGLWPDSTIDVVRTAPFGDPMEYRLHGYRLALRRDEAIRVFVRVPTRSRS